MKDTLAVLSELATGLSKHCKLSFMATLLCVATSTARANQYVAATALEPEKNLVSTHYFKPAVSYLPAERAWNRWIGSNFTVQNEELLIPKTPDGKTNRAQISLSWSTILADQLEISFDYSLQGKGTLVVCGKDFRLQSGDNQGFKAEVPVSLIPGSGTITFSCSGADGRMTVKNLVVTPVKPKGGPAKPLLADGVKVDSIYFAETSAKHTFLDQRGANLMQKNLYLAGGGVLPIKVLSKGQRPGNGIIIGQAAKEYISSESLKEVGEGGYALKVDKGIAAVYGDDSYANSGGVLALLKKIGFLYLTSNEYITPTGTELNLSRLEESLTPAIAWRMSAHQGEPIAEGMSDPVCLSDFKVLGTYRGFGHSFPFIIGWDEFKDSDPEFFAMQEDGLRRKSERGDFHYCSSNEKLQQLAVERIRELLDADPIGKMFFLGPGDGMNLYCRCEKCKALGTPTDARMYFSNCIAEQLQKSHPDVILCISAYTDTAPAPQKYKPASNVLVKYCPYEPYWMNHKKLIADPEGTLGAELPRVQVRTDYGYSIPALGMFGGRAIDSSWLRASSAPTKQLYRPSSGFGMTRMSLTLDKMPTKPITIKTNGIDNEKAEPATMRLLVNGEQVYDGKVPWKKDAWSWQSFTVPASFWTTGENEIQFLNTTPDEEVFNQGRPVAKNYYWGWYIIDECQFLVE